MLAKEIILNKARFESFKSRKLFTGEWEANEAGELVVVTFYLCESNLDEFFMAAYAIGLSDGVIKAKEDQSREIRKRSRWLWS